MLTLKTIDTQIDLIKDPVNLLKYTYRHYEDGSERYYYTGKDKIEVLITEPSQDGYTGLSLEMVKTLFKGLIEKYKGCQDETIFMFDN